MSPGSAPTQGLKTPTHTGRKAATITQFTTEVSPASLFKPVTPKTAPSSAKSAVNEQSPMPQGQTGVKTPTQGNRKTPTQGGKKTPSIKQFAVPQSSPFILPSTSKSATSLAGVGGGVHRTSPAGSSPLATALNSTPRTPSQPSRVEYRDSGTPRRDSKDIKTTPQTSLFKAESCKAPKPRSTLLDLLTAKGATSNMTQGQQTPAPVSQSGKDLGKGSKSGLVANSSGVHGKGTAEQPVEID